jgi:hypothetical protein
MPVKTALRNRLDLAAEFAARGYTYGAEIGVADGRFSLTLCQTIPNLRLLCIDPWMPYEGNTRGGGVDQHHRNYALARERLQPYNATLIRSTAADAFRIVVDGPLDFVYIDGNHDFDYVMLDLILWTPKVRKGGIVAGHDYYHFGQAGVIPAVDAYCAAHGITPTILGEVRKHSKDDDQPTWYWER